MQPREIKDVHFIFYVSDQSKSTWFYETLLGITPRLNVPGMTEFELKSGVVLGLMPESGICKLLGSSIQDPSGAHNSPRAEIYLILPNARELYEVAISMGAKELSPFTKRDWGHSAGYFSDPDGHIVAFARDN